MVLAMAILELRSHFPIQVSGDPAVSGKSDEEACQQQRDFTGERLLQYFFQELLSGRQSLVDTYIVIMKSRLTLDTGQRED